MSTALVPNFEAAFLAIDRVAQLLKRVTEALDDAGVPYASVAYRGP